METTARRAIDLPGVRFETVANEGSADLPRLDITGFVGLAEAGPFDVPVLIEDVLRFREIFGVDLELSFEQDDTAATRSVLGPTVESFFANGGRSCWVVRVGSAGDAETTIFRVPGLVAADSLAGVVTGVDVEARSAGSAFDRLHAIAWLDRRHVPVPREAKFDSAHGEVTLPATARVGLGDLIELTYPERPTLWATVRDVAVDDLGRRRVAWDIADEHWWSAPLQRGRDNVTASLTGTPLSDVTCEFDGDGSAELTTSTPVDTATFGDIVVIEPDMAAPHRELFSIDRPAGRGTDDTWVLGGRISREIWSASVGRAAVSFPVACAVLKLAIGARQSSGLVAEQRDLDVGTGSARSWQHLLSDVDLFGGHYRRAASAGEHPTAGPLDHELSAPRFPFACPGGRPILPLFLADDAVVAVPGEARHSGASPQRRNGVDVWSTSWFVDPDFAGRSVEGIRLDASRQFFVDGLPLRGALSLYPLQDVAVVSAPDCVHVGWQDVATTAPGPLPAPILAVEDELDLLSWDLYTGPASAGFEVECSSAPDFSLAIERMPVDAQEHHVEWRGCETVWCRVRATEGSRTSPWSNTVALQPGISAFAPCDVAPQPIPELEIVDGSTLRWQLLPTPAGGQTQYDIESSADALFRGADRRRSTAVAAAQPQETEIATDSTSAQHWRVRERSGERGIGPWSNTVTVGGDPTQVRVANVLGGVTAPDTIDIHRHLAAFAAARQDVTVLLSFPFEYGFDQLEGHVAELQADSWIPGGGERTWGDYLHPHHPWLGAPSSDRRVWFPPDGAIAGALAGTARRRGPWIAAVQRPLVGITATSQRLDSQGLLRMRQLQVNGFHDHAQRTYVSGVDTLSTDPMSIAVTIRRLIIMLRRLGRRESEAIVFENNGPLLWGIVRRRFETVCGGLLRRGALAGRTPAEAYRVICDGSVNTPSSIDNGRLIIELQVAPSHPLEFLTVRLLQTDAGGFEFMAVSA